jgi:hypothetical protein
MEGNRAISAYNPKLQSDPLLQQILSGIQAISGHADRVREDYRANLVLNKEKLFSVLEGDDILNAPKRTLICYFAGPGGGGIDLSDAAPIGSMLDAVGETEELDLMINSPGGSGEAAEKIIEMCREHCTSMFRVIVPNYAKSAATMITLGADVIVMGYPSELGPIDPQYQITIADTQQLVSAQSFIQAYDRAQQQVKDAVAANESPVGYLQSLSASTMEPAFIEHCRRSIDFSRDIAKKFLPKYQLPALYESLGETRADSTLKRRAKKIAEDLLSANTRFSHGRLISAQEAQDIGLHVEPLDRDDPVWRAYWELYVRAEVYMQLKSADGGPVSKIFFDRSSTLPMY